MSPRLLAQLGAVYLAEANALREDPDGKLKSKDGFREFLRDDLARPLSVEELREYDRLDVSSRRLFYLARAGGLTCSCCECLFGEPERCFRRAS